MLNRAKILYGLHTVLAFLVSAHVCTAQFIDDFSDGDFSNNPSWSGNGSEFTVQSNRLRLAAPAVADVAYLSTLSAAINHATWEFFVQLDFDPSGSNYVDVYLASDNAVLSEPLQGYFVRIGNTTDEVSLYRQDGTTKTRIIDGLDGRVTAASVTVKVKVTRNDAGDWQLFSDPAVTGAFLSEGATTDATHFSSTHTGVLCVYTATRSDDFYFDDFVVSGDPYVDPSTPAEPKDVIISEIFADPTPTVGLPDVEFVELFNRSSKIINLNGWKFSDGSSIAVLPHRLLQPNEYLVVTAATSMAQYESFGSVLGISNFPTLNNTGDNLILKRSDDQLIDQVNYSEDWYRDEDKLQGGYTLELIDPANPCGEEENWTAAEATQGGTPGTQNSVFANKPDLTGPKLIAAIPTSATGLELTFDEKLETDIPEVADFLITPAVSITQAFFSDASLKSVTLQLNESLQFSVLYSITVQNILDCNENPVQPEFDTVVFGLPEDAVELDIGINEILFNPRPTGVDFVEVHNNSSKFINLKNWSVANVENEIAINPQPITTKDFLFEPGAYLVFTESGNVLKGEYISAVEENLFEVINLPGFNDDEGTVALVDDHNTIIDFFSYSDNYHSAFLSEDEGVSLERISGGEQTNNPTNWKSANASVGFATPGYINSNARTDQATGKVTVIPEVFEPVTGQPDFTQIQYSFDQGGLVANIKILDFQGRQIKQLANNSTLATSGFFRWDGDTEEGTKARAGYYVVWVEVFNANGKVDTYRKRVVVAAGH